MLFWGLKNGQEVVRPCWAPKCHFLNLLKPQFLEHFQEKLVVAFFFEKGYVRKRAKQNTEKKNDNCLGSLSLMHFWVVFLASVKRGGFGGGASPPKDERRRVMSEMLLLLLFLLCCFFAVLLLLLLLFSNNFFLLSLLLLFFLFHICLLLHNHLHFHLLCHPIFHCHDAVLLLFLFVFVWLLLLLLLLLFWCCCWYAVIGRISLFWWCCYVDMLVLFCWHYIVVYVVSVFSVKPVV